MVTTPTKKRYNNMKRKKKLSNRSIFIDLPDRNLKKFKQLYHKPLTIFPLIYLFLIIHHIKNLKLE